MVNEIWKDIRTKLHLPKKNKPTRDLIFRCIKKISGSSTTIETKPNLVIKLGEWQ